MSSQPGLQTIAIQILPNISQSKGNQTMRFECVLQLFVLHGQKVKTKS